MDIEPCWWCGRDAKSQWFLARHWVGCSDKFQCGARGPCADTPEAAIAAWNHVAGQRWRPIETAPRADAWFLAWNGKEAIMGRFIMGRFLATSGGREMSLDPTHWRPLPDPPEPPPIETSGYVEIIEEGAGM